MSRVVDNATRFLSNSYYSFWAWINGLDRHEWFTLLIVVMVLGFLCMRGFGSRKNY